jgi:zinc transport system permease protein
MSISALISDPFLQMALWASLLASIASGTIGSFVVIKRIAFLAGSISHAVLGGIGFCLWLQRTYDLPWLDPLYGAFGASIASALLLGWVHLNYRQREDTIISAIWSTGMAVGVIFLSLTPGTNVELMNFLFGNILWIGAKDLLLLALLDAVILSVVFFYYRRFLALCFDEQQALLRAIPVQRLYLLLLCLIALSIVLLMQLIGTILVIALLTLPATIAALFTYRLPLIMLWAVLLSSLFSIAGLQISYLFDWPPGSTIALIAALAYLILLPLAKKKFRWRLRNGR